jgi:hypothetical protein
MEVLNMKRKIVITTVLVASMIVSAVPTLAVIKSEAKPERSTVAVKAEAKPERSAVAVKAEAKPERSAVAVKAEAKPERSAVAVKAEAKPERVKAVALWSDGPIVPELPAVPFA